MGIKSNFFRLINNRDLNRVHCEIKCVCRNVYIYFIQFVFTFVLQITKKDVYKKDQIAEILNLNRIFYSFHFQITYYCDYICNIKF